MEGDGDNAQAAQAEKVSTFMAVAGCDSDYAVTFLDANGWDIDRAINMFLAEGGVGEQGGADPQLPGAGLEGAEEEVRAPIPQKMDKLVQDMFDHPHAAGPRAARRAPAGPFGPEGQQDEAFRSFEEEERSMQRMGEDDLDALDEQPKKPRNLADIYRPPYEIIFDGTFDQLRAKGREEGRWLVVNIQSTMEFASQQLNSDTWRDEGLRCARVLHACKHCSPLGARSISLARRPVDGAPAQGRHFRLFPLLAAAARLAAGRPVRDPLQPLPPATHWHH